MRLGIALLVLAGSLLGCDQAASIPTEQEADGFLVQFVAVAQAGNFARLCELADCFSGDTLTVADVPSSSPTVMGSRVLASGTANGQDTIGGRVLVLCGVDAQGQRYQSEMLVFRASGGLRTLAPRYWINGGVAGPGDPTTASSPLPGVTCPA